MRLFRVLSIRRWPNSSNLWTRGIMMCRKRRRLALDRSFHQELLGSTSFTRCHIIFAMVSLNIESSSFLAGRPRRNRAAPARDLARGGPTRRSIEHAVECLPTAVKKPPGARCASGACAAKWASNRHVVGRSFRGQPAAFVVNLRRRDVSVAKQLLDGADVLAVCQEQRGGRGTG
jgi:hypothetical protein